MPSLTAREAALVIERVIKRPLHECEWLKVEELVFNFHLRTIETFSRRLKNAVTFGIIYYPLINGHLTYARKHLGIVHFIGRMKEVYELLDGYIGRTYADSEIDAMKFLADECTDEQVKKGLRIAVRYGVHSARYIKKIIHGMRQRAIPDEPAPNVWEDLSKIQNVNTRAARAAWRQRLERNSERQLAKRAASLAQQKLLGRNRANDTGSDQASKDAASHNRRNRASGD